MTHLIPQGQTRGQIPMKEPIHGAKTLESMKGANEVGGWEGGRDAKTLESMREAIMYRQLL
jgi:hypothetical protein